MMAPRIHSKRAASIKKEYERLIDQHLLSLVSGDVEYMLEIEDFAQLLFIHPVHLTNTLKASYGISACGIYQLKILEMAKQLLADANRPIYDVALTLTFEPSQFTKWFRRIGGMTPKAYRASLTGRRILN